MKITFIFSCSGMFRNVPCSGFYQRPKNCPFPLPFLTVIEFRRVKKSPLIIGIE